MTPLLDHFPGRTRRVMHRETYDTPFLHLIPNVRTFHDPQEGGAGFENSRSEPYVRHNPHARARRRRFATTSLARGGETKSFRTHRVHSFISPARVETTDERESVERKTNDVSFYFCSSHRTRSDRGKGEPSNFQLAHLRRRIANSIHSRRSSARDRETGRAFGDRRAPKRPGYPRDTLKENSIASKCRRSGRFARRASRRDG